MASYIDCRVSFQIMSSQLNLLQYKLEKHLTDDQGKQDPPELNYEYMYLLPYNVKLSHLRTLQITIQISEGI